MASVELTPSGQRLYEAISGFVKNGEDWIDKNLLRTGILKNELNPLYGIQKGVSTATGVYDHWLDTGNFDYHPEVESGRTAGQLGAEGYTGTPSAGAPSAGAPSAGAPSAGAPSAGAAGSGSGSINSYIDMVNAVTDRNNAWAAAQAQKQMDFQKMMSDTAHQREVADLKAAGLNPVLSAGGSGAASASGAMATPDTTNSRIIGEIALNAVEGLSNSATGLSYGMNKVADAASDNGRAERQKKINDVIWKTVIPTIVRSVLR